MSNQVIPIGRSGVSRGGFSNFNTTAPDTVVSILALCIRFGHNAKKPIGGIQSMTFSLKRQVKEYYEITAYPPATFGSLDALFSETSFNDSTVYDGEPTTIIPGVQEPIDVKITRPMFYSSNILDAVFKTTGSGEFTVNEGHEFRYLSTIGQAQGTMSVGSVLRGAAAGAVVSGLTGQGLAQGAVGGAIQALLPVEDYTPERARYGSLLQQIRPLNIYYMVMSPTEKNKVLYALEFINGWSTDWSINGISVDQQVVMEELSMKFERVRVYRET
jgi:hypothetical protein